MTKQSNLEMVATDKASDLIKDTAERTATALNIQYIQKDIVDIKQVLKDISARDDTYVRKSELDITKFAQKDEFLYWRNILVGGILVTFGLGLSLNLFRH